MNPVVLQLVYTVFINTINTVSIFWRGIKQNKKNNIKSTKSSWPDSAVNSLWATVALLPSLNNYVESENHETFRS